MEVHHHPHVEKKNFAAYFLEFLMIFLAVTMGFFAESIRENMAEKKKLHGYMQQMIENMKFDASRCELALKSNKNSSDYLDSLRYEIDSAAGGHGNINALYYCYFKSTDFKYVNFKQSAITQLKNSGNLRLVENDKLVNDILEYYDRWLSVTNARRESEGNYRDALNNNIINFLNLNSFEYLIKKDTVFSFTPDTATSNYMASLLSRKPALALLNMDPSGLKKLNNIVVQDEMSRHDYNSLLRLDKNLADSLISQIQKEYDFNSKQR